MGMHAKGLFCGGRLGIVVGEFFVEQAGWRAVARTSLDQKQDLTVFDRKRIGPIAADAILPRIGEL